MSKRVWAIVLVTAAGTACASAPRTRSFQDLPRYLRQGNTVGLTETTGLMTTGRVQALSPTALTILADGTLREVPENQVAKIQRSERNTGRGALIGLGVGMVAGLIAGRSGEPSGHPLIDTQAAAGNAAASTLLGTALGAIVGAIVKVNRTVYLAPVTPMPEPQGPSARPAVQPAAAPGGR